MPTGFWALGRRRKGVGKVETARLPLPLAFVLVPIAGALYVILLPFVGLALLAYALALTAGRGLRAAGRALLVWMDIPAWLPGHSYLWRHLPRQQRPGDFAQSLENEIRRLPREASEKGERRG